MHVDKTWVPEPSVPNAHPGFRESTNRVLLCHGQQAVSPMMVVRSCKQDSFGTMKRRKSLAPLFYVNEHLVRAYTCSGPTFPTIRGYDQAWLTAQVLVETKLYGSWQRMSA